MKQKGDTERQATLRDRIIKKNRKKNDRYVEKILSAVKTGTRLLDIGCGTGHIIYELAFSNRNNLYIGLDISEAMLKIANVNTLGLSEVIFIEADGLQLPFSDQSFDVAITRLAEYSIQEVRRILKNKGYFFEYGLGPDADKEIKEFFPERIESENFFIPKNITKWQEEVCKNITDAGFIINDIEEHVEKEHFQNEEELIDIIEMVPLVKDFDRKSDGKIVKNLAEKYRDRKGFSTTWHYYIIQAQRL